MEDGCRFRHLHHKGRTSSCQVIARPNTSEHPVHHTQACRARWNERTHLRQDHDQRRLPQICGFATHVGAGEHQHSLRGGVQIQVIGYETLAACGKLLLLDDGMSPSYNFEI